MEELYAASTADYSAVIRRKQILIAATILMMLSLCPTAMATRHVLIYTRNSEGFVHDNIPASVECIKMICRANGWTYEVTAIDDSSLFNDAAHIASFDALIFTNTNNDAFDNDDQRKVFQDYIRGGGAFVGIHSACGSERKWPWFWANLGGKFVYHPPYQTFEVKVIDRDHPSTAHLPDRWTWQDEFYYMDELNPAITVLLAGDLRTVKCDRKERFPGRMFGDYFPLAWYQTFEGGRQWYTALGHSIEHYKDENFVKHIEGGIRWALNSAVVEANTCGDADTAQ